MSSAYAHEASESEADGIDMAKPRQENGNTCDGKGHGREQATTRHGGIE